MFFSYKIIWFFTTYRQVPCKEIKSKNKKIQSFHIFSLQSSPLIHVPLHKETCTFTWIYLTANAKHRQCRPRFETKSGLRFIDPGIPSQSTQPVNYFILLKHKDNVEFKISMQKHHTKALACFIWKFPRVNRKHIFYFKHSIIWF